MTETDDPPDFIHVYTRAQALADGQLIDLRATEDHDRIAARNCWTLPIACTPSVYAECIDPTPAAKRAGLTLDQRLETLLYGAWLATRAALQRDPDTRCVEWRMYIVRSFRVSTDTRLQIHCGPGDNGEPVLTIMFPGEN